MKISTKRRLAALMGISLLGALVSAGPAVADVDSPICSTLIQTTPGIEVDLDNDGNPEFRAPRIYDVTLCTDASASYVTYPPTTENCSSVPKVPTCMAVRITVLPAYASAYAAAEVCASIEGGGRTCVPADTGNWAGFQPRTICVGFDLNGGHPCDGSMLTFD